MTAKPVSTRKATIYDVFIIKQWSQLLPEETVFLVSSADDNGPRTPLLPETTICLAFPDKSAANLKKTCSLRLSSLR